MAWKHYVFPFLLTAIEEGQLLFRKLFHVANIPLFAIHYKILARKIVIRSALLFEAAVQPAILCINHEALTYQIAVQSGCIVELNNWSLWFNPFPGRRHPEVSQKFDDPKSTNFVKHYSPTKKLSICISKNTYHTWQFNCSLPILSRWSASTLLLQATSTYQSAHT